jgi:hypothetical protein
MSQKLINLCKLVGYFWENVNATRDSLHSSRPFLHQERGFVKYCQWIYCTQEFSQISYETAHGALRDIFQIIY